MRTFFARFLSIAVHPFVVLALLLLLLHADQTPLKVVQTMAAFAGLVVLPVGLLAWYAQATGRWRTVDASDKADRPLLFLVLGLVLLAMGTYFGLVEHARAAVRGCVVSGAMMLVAFLLNRWVKLSLHVACAAFCGVLLASAGFRAGWLLLGCLPALMWSRVALARHLPAETIGGLILGAAGAGCLVWW